MKRITVRFYLSQLGKEPVRKWLLKLTKLDRALIGEDIKTVEFGWPIGMPVVRKLDSDLWEVRSNLSGGRIARVIFTVSKSTMVLLHGFIKKTQKTPKPDIELAKKRRNDVLS